MLHVDRFFILKIELLEQKLITFIIWRHSIVTHFGNFFPKNFTINILEAATDIAEKVKSLSPTN